jgi:hypothetical protein
VPEPHISWIHFKFIQWQIHLWIHLCAYCKLSPHSMQSAIHKSIWWCHDVRVLLPMRALGENRFSRTRLRIETQLESHTVASGWSLKLCNWQLIKLIAVADALSRLLVRCSSRLHRCRGYYLCSGMSLAAVME